MKNILVALVLILSLENLHAQTLVFVFLNKKADKAVIPKEEETKLMDGHMANIKRLGSEGKLIVAGPFEGGGGIFIFKSKSVQEVAEWVNSDPAVQAKRWDIEIFPFEPGMGAVCQASEPIDMIQYNFVRYEMNVSKYTLAAMAEASKEHERYVKQLGLKMDVLLAGSLGPEEGGILVTRGEFNKDMVESDPVLQKEFMTVSYKSLYVAKGAFCEK